MIDKDAVAKAVERYLVGSGEPIKNLADLEAVPGYEQQIEFGEKVGRSIKDMLEKYELAKVDEVPCGIKGCRKKHMYGYLVVSSDGRITNIGQDCGRNHLGLNFSSAKASYNVRRKAISNRKAVDQIRAELAKHQDRISRIKSLSSALNRCREVIREWMPIQAGELIEMAYKQRSVIVVERQMSKREAAVHFAQTGTSRKDYVGGRPMVTEEVGRLVGVAFFGSDLSAFISKSVSPAINEVSALTDSDIDELSAQAISDLSKRLGDSLRNIREAEKIADHGLRFFTPDNAAKLKLMGASEENVKRLAPALSELAVFHSQ